MSGASVDAVLIGCWSWWEESWINSGAQATASEEPRGPFRRLVPVKYLPMLTWVVAAQALANPPDQNRFPGRQSVEKTRPLGNFLSFTVAMNFYRHVPRAPLDQHVEFLWQYEDLAVGHDREHVLPDGSFELMFNLDSRPRRIFGEDGGPEIQRFTRGWLSGAHQRYLVIDALPGSSMIGAHFRPGGAAAVLGFPASELTGSVAELDTFWGGQVWNWRDRLLEALGPRQKFRVFEEFLAARMVLASRGSAGSPAILRALQHLLDGSGAQRIDQLATQLGMSHKHFIERFRGTVGLAPKAFYRVRRFRRALESVHKRRQVDWARLAADCGYFDQAHFIKDFTSFSGLSPSAYRAAANPEEPGFAPAPAR